MLVPKPKLILEIAEKSIPNRVWRAIERARAKKKKHWPSWCYMPFLDFVDILDNHRVNIGPNRAHAFTRLHILAVWRTSKGIYRIHGGLCPELLKTRMSGAIPFDTLCCLPEWCVYVELPPAIPICVQSYTGFFAMLSLFNRYDHTPSLHVGWVKGRNSALVIDELPIIGSLQESVEHMAKVGTVLDPDRDPHKFSPLSQQDQQDLENRFNVALQILLYLVATNADIRSSVGIQTPSQRPMAINVGKAPTSPKQWDVGFRLGPALRNHLPVQGLATHGNPPCARQGFSMRPHVRRAHWHHFWTGSTRDQSRRELKLKWLHPILVNVEDPEDLIPTIRNVEGSS